MFWVRSTHPNHFKPQQSTHGIRKYLQYSHLSEDDTIKGTLMQI